MKSSRFMLLPAFLIAGALFAQDAQVTQLMLKDLPECPGKEGLMITVVYPPGGSDPIHRHNAHGFIYVLEGSIVMQVKGGKEVTLMQIPQQCGGAGPSHGEEADLAGERLRLILHGVADVARNRSRAHDPEGPGEMGSEGGRDSGRLLSYSTEPTPPGSLTSPIRKIRPPPVDDVNNLRH